MSSPTQYFVWARMRCDPNAAWKNKIGRHSQNNHFKEWNRIWRHADCVRVENIPRIHDVGHPRRDSKNWWKSIQYESEYSTAESSSCQCIITLYGEKTETQRMYSEFFWSFKICSPVSLRSLVILGTWIREEMGRELFRWTRRKFEQNCRNDDTPIKYRIWSLTFFEHPVPLKEESWTAKNMAKSLHNSTIMEETLTCFSARWFLSISSVSTEPWQICAKNWTKIHSMIQLKIPPKIQKAQEHFVQKKY